MDFAKRIQNARKILSKEKLDGLLVTTVSNIIYLTGYSGFSYDEREAFLVITKNKEFLITDGRYSEAVKHYIPHFLLIEINPSKPLNKILKQMVHDEKISRLGFEANNLTYLEYERFKKIIHELIKIDLSSLRIIKDDKEIKYIKEACRIADLAFDYILKRIKLNITEKELAFILESFLKKKGAEPSFPTIVAYGAHSAIPHHQTSNEKLTKNNIILLDFGAKLNNYCSDITRTIYLGKADDKFRNVYNTVLEAQEKAIDFLQNFKYKIKSGIMVNTVDNISRKYILKKGFPSIPHSLGHGIGIEVHEAPRISPKNKEILKEGMVFSIEPGIYISGWGGVRTEDLIALKASGLEILTKSRKNLVEIK